MKSVGGLSSATAGLRLLTLTVVMISCVEGVSYLIYSLETLFLTRFAFDLKLLVHVLLSLEL